MKQKYLIMMMALLAFAFRATGQEVSGIVLDENNEPLIGATVLEQGTTNGVTTNLEGKYSFAVSKIPTRLVISYVGHTDKIVEVNSAGDQGSAILAVGIFLDTDVIVTASRKPEKVTESPAAVSLVSSRDISLMATEGDALNNIKNLPGVRIVNNGIAKMNVSLRGQALVNETLTLVLKDYRSIANPHTTIIDNERMGVNPLDIDRIEVIKGPSGALWGPGVNAGVVHFLTKDPFKYPGTSVNVGYSVEGQGVAKINFRHAASSEKFGYKILVSHRSGNDFVYDLSNPDDLAAARATIEAAGPPPGRDGIISPVVEGADALTLPSIIASDGNVAYNLIEPFHSNTVEASFEFRPTNDLKLTFAPQWGESLINFRNDGSHTRDWGTIFDLQGRVNYKDFFVSVNYFLAPEWKDALHGNTDLGTTLNGNRSTSYISTGTSNRGNIQVFDVTSQLPFSGGENLDFVAGGDIRLLRFRGVPDGLEDVIVSRAGRNEDDDDFDTYGAYLQGTYKVSNNFKVNAVGRFDFFSVYGAAFSPRLGAVYNPGGNKDHAIRAGFSTSYRAPSPIVTYFDLVLAGQNVWGSRRPMTFNNVALKQGGGGVKLTTATPSLNDVLALVYTDLDAADQATLTGVNLAGNLTPSIVDPLTGVVFDQVSDQYLPAAGLESTNAIELGYSGSTADKKLKFSLDAFWQRQQGMLTNFTYSGPIVSFPDLSAELTAALTDAGVDAATASRVVDAAAASMFAGNFDAIADQHQGLPQFENNPFRSSGFRRVNGQADYIGLEGSISYVTTNGWSPFFNVSWLSDVVFDATDLGQPEGSNNFYYLNTPPTRIRFGLNKQQVGDKGFYGNITGRYDSGFEALNNAWTGDVPSYFMVDASVGYTFDYGLKVGVSSTNLTDELYRPFPLLPAQRRLIFVDLTYNLSHNMLHGK